MSTEREITLLPSGVRVYLPRESRKKRMLIAELFREAQGWDFQELDLPTLDYYESITRGVSEDLARRTYQFQDDEGELLALRPDATAQVAKILSGRFDPAELPGRYCYACRNFRAFELRRGELREFHQFGVEILSRDRFQSDLELLLFVLEQLEGFGLENVVLDLGHVEVYKSLVADVQLSDGEAQTLRQLIHHKNVHGLRELLENLRIPDSSKQVLQRLPTLYGGKEIFERIHDHDGLSEQTHRALDYLYDIYQHFVEAGFEDWISVDLGVVRGLDYYTGIVFEALLEGIGKPIVGGGRYDKLYETYGEPMPATGCAIELDRLIPVVDRDLELPPRQDVWCPTITPAARAALDALREQYRVNVIFDQPGPNAQGVLVGPDGETRRLED